MPTDGRPLPVADADSLPFWEGTRLRQIRVQRCLGCSSFRWPPARYCPNCGSSDAEWKQLAGTGRIASYVVVCQPSVAGPFAEDVPYAIAKVIMDGTDGHVLLTANVTGHAWQELAVGMSVDAWFDEVSEEFTLPRFRIVA